MLRIQRKQIKSNKKIVKHFFCILKKKLLFQIRTGNLSFYPFQICPNIETWGNYEIWGPVRQKSPRPSDHSAPSYCPSTSGKSPEIRTGIYLLALTQPGVNLWEVCRIMYLITSSFSLVRNLHFPLLIIKIRWNPFDWLFA